MPETGRLRIGELSKRVGESPELLRAWESRYGLVEPERTAGGLRLYSESDERRVRLMRQHIDAGLSAAEAARLTKAGDGAGTPAAGPSRADVQAMLEDSFDAMDEPAAQAALDRIFATFDLREALGEIILPFLNRLGLRWEESEVSVAQEHFASNVIGGRLRALARGWGEGVGPIAILACPPGERHELGLLCFGLGLRERGWRIVYLGADTPISEIASTVDALSPAIVVLAARSPRLFSSRAEEISALAGQVRVGLAGAGASAALAERLGGDPLIGDVLEVAERLRP